MPFPQTHAASGTAVFSPFLLQSKARKCIIVNVSYLFGTRLRIRFQSERYNGTPSIHAEAPHRFFRAGLLFVSGNAAGTATGSNFSIGTGISPVTPEQDARYMELAAKANRTADEDAELENMVREAAKAKALC